MEEQIVKDVVLPEDAPEIAAPTSAEDPERTAGDNFMSLSLVDTFNLSPDGLTAKQKQWLNEIWEWGRTQTDSEDPSDIRWAIISKRNALGSPRLGENYLGHFMVWLTAYRGYAQAERRLREVEGAAR